MNDNYKLGHICIRLGLGLSILFTIIWYIKGGGSVSEITFVLIGFILALAGIVAKIIGVLEAQGISLDNQEKRSE